MSDENKDVEKEESLNTDSNPFEMSAEEALAKKNQEFLEPFEKDYRLLLEYGFVAIKQKDEDSAIRLFGAAQLLNPDHNAWKMGFGYIHLHKMEIKQATIIFKEILSLNKDDEVVQCLLGMCYALTKGQLARSERVFKKILSTTKDETVKNLAETLMKWKDNEIHKKSAKFFVPTEKDNHLYEEDSFLENS